MYLTRITLAPQAFRARSLLTSQQTLHAALAASFPVSGEQGGRILWRLDHSTGGAEPVLFVASPNGPDMDEVTERIVTPDRIITKDFTPVLDSITVGANYSFRLTGNPTGHKRSTSDSTPVSGGPGNFHRFPLYKHDQQVEWLVKKLNVAGATINPINIADVEARASILDVVVDGERSDSFGRRNSSNGCRSDVTILRVGFKGHLTVTDPTKFRDALASGIGPAKAYGCGLLTIAR